MDLKHINIHGQGLVNKPQNQNQTTFEKKARETADSFEAVFLSQILKSMSTGIKSDGPTGGGHSEEMFRELLNEQIANQISRNGGVGLSDAVYREILKTQDVGIAGAANGK